MKSKIMFILSSVLIITCISGIMTFAAVAKTNNKDTGGVVYTAEYMENFLKGVNWSKTPTVYFNEAETGISDEELADAIRYMETSPDWVNQNDIRDILKKTDFDMNFYPYTKVDGAASIGYNYLPAEVNLRTIISAVFADGETVYLNLYSLNSALQYYNISRLLFDKDALEDGKKVLHVFNEDLEKFGWVTMGYLRDNIDAAVFEKLKYNPVIQELNGELGEDKSSVKFKIITAVSTGSFYISPTDLDYFFRCVGYDYYISSMSMLKAGFTDDALVYTAEYIKDSPDWVNLDDVRKYLKEIDPPGISLDYDSKSRSVSVKRGEETEDKVITVVFGNNRYIYTDIRSLNSALTSSDVARLSFDEKALEKGDKVLVASKNDLEDKGWVTLDYLRDNMRAEVFDKFVYNAEKQALFAERDGETQIPIRIIKTGESEFYIYPNDINTCFQAWGYGYRIRRGQMSRPTPFYKDEPLYTLEYIENSPEWVDWSDVRKIFDNNMRKIYFPYNVDFNGAYIVVRRSRFEDNFKYIATAVFGDEYITGLFGDISTYASVGDATVFGSKYYVKLDELNDALRSIKLPSLSQDGNILVISEESLMDEGYVSLDYLRDNIEPAVFERFSYDPEEQVLYGERDGKKPRELIIIIADENSIYIDRESLNWYFKELKYRYELPAPKRE